MLRSNLAKILTTGGPFWGTSGQNWGGGGAKSYLGPPTQIFGGAMAPLAPPVPPPLLSEEEKEKFFVSRSDDNWFCSECVSFLQDSIKWGCMIGVDDISNKLDSMYDEIICWRLNLFEVPKGKAGKDFIMELDRLLSKLTFKTNWKSLSLKLIHVYIIGADFLSIFVLNILKIFFNIAIFSLENFNLTLHYN